jgi:predicted nucleic acid-binding protein
MPKDEAMRTVFADTSYWLALTNFQDQWHTRARQLSVELQPCRVVTTDEVLVEFLNWYRNKGSVVRRFAVRQVHRILAHRDVTVLEQSHTSFLSGIELYESRSDKEYSLTDCISMAAMRGQELTEALTTDRHFEQEGFVLLLKR